MRGVSLTKLRVAFAVAGAVLLAPLSWLTWVTDQRLEEQRRLRHEIVAERIFDEMERELGALLERERERPSSAYATDDTRVASWAPFVVGYFTRDASGLRLVAEAQLPMERRTRVTGAVKHVWGRPELSALRAPHSAPVPTEQTRPSVEASVADDAPPARVPRRARAPRTTKSSDDDLLRNPYPARQEDVLKQLNRSAEKRSKKSRRAPQDDSVQDDPLSGLE